jgi:hypothetical protein
MRPRHAATVAQAAALRKQGGAMAALISAADLGIDTATDQGLFDWLLASLLFGRPVPQEAAASAFRKFKEDGWDSPDHFTADDHHPFWHEVAALHDRLAQDIFDRYSSTPGGSMAPRRPSPMCPPTLPSG